ncbi:RNA polymerase M/15 kDa subunit [Apiospora hydei]|uniref:RNA polymerase M/15 kDa subunit n=1 Tax=Apiospora hydei TaxID=1337664 RepID=A0ABR1V5S3_9PEZI
MSSPQSTSGQPEQKKAPFEQVTFRFCSECSNMLYPKEDEDSHKLQFTCRTCQYTEEANSTCVFRNVMNNAVGETAGVTQDVGSDPTVRIDLSLPESASAPSVAAPQPGFVGESHGSDTEPLDPSSDAAEGDPALCMRCGFVLLQCRRCDRPASADQYNALVQSDPEFATRRAMQFIQVANAYNHLSPNEQGAWEVNFASCNMPRHTNDDSGQHQPLPSYEFSGER